MRAQRLLIRTLKRRKRRTKVLSEGKIRRCLLRCSKLDGGNCQFSAQNLCRANGKTARPLILPAFRRVCEQVLLDAAAQAAKTRDTIRQASRQASRGADFFPACLSGFAARAAAPMLACSRAKAFVTSKDYFFCFFSDFRKIKYIKKNKTS